MTTLHEARNVIALFTYCRCTEMNLGLLLIYISACGIVLSVSQILGWGSFLFCFGFVHGSLLHDKNSIFVKY